MNTTTPTTINIQEMVNSLTKVFNDNLKKSAQIAWDALLDYLIHYWLYILLFIFILLIITTIKAIFGRWGSLGSLLYNLFYFGILFIIGLIFGSEVFLNNFFGAACSVILYPICYWLVGLILDNTGLK